MVHGQCQHKGGYLIDWLSLKQERAMPFHHWFPTGFQPDKQPLIQMTFVIERMYVRVVHSRGVGQVTLVSRPGDGNAVFYPKGSYWTLSLC